MSRESSFRHCTNDLPAAELLKYRKRTLGDWSLDLGNRISCRLTKEQKWQLLFDKNWENLAPASQTKWLVYLKHTFATLQPSWQMQCLLKVLLAYMV